MKDVYKEISTRNLVAILIDMQDFFLKNFNPDVRRTLLTNQSKVIELCRKNKVPLIVFEYKAGGVFRGNTTSILRKKIKRLKNTVIIKDNNGGFTDTNLDQILKDMKCKRLLLMGINANGCVQDTAMGALRRGYKVITAKGLIASSRKDGKYLSKKNEKWYKKNAKYLGN